MTVAKTAPDPEQNAAARQMAVYLKIGVPVGTVLLTIAVGAVLGPAAGILVLAGGALVGVIATFWASVRTLFGETPLSGADAYAIGAPRAEEEQKQAVLRALKDLEFERSVGKISEEDYRAMVAKYRAEAKRLLRLLDEEAQPRRDQVQALVEKRLRREGLLEISYRDAANTENVYAPAREETAAEVAPHVRKKRATAAAARAKKGARPVESAVKEREAPIASANPICLFCGTVADADAIFCKRCGKKCVSPQESAAEKAAQSDAETTETPDTGAGA